MKVTKYPQSCLLLEKAGKRIVIDPGKFFSAHYNVADFGKVEAILYTHQHGDHYDNSLLDQFRADGVKLYGNKAVSQLIGPDAIVVNDGEAFSIAGFHILPHNIPHFEKPGVDMPLNTGYIIDGNFFHPGDGIKNNGVQVSNFAVPIAGAFGLDTVVAFMTSVGATKVIPIHYSNQEMYPSDPSEFVKAAGSTAKIILLQDGQSVEL